MNRPQYTRYTIPCIFLLVYLLAGELSIQLGTINPGNMALIWLAAGIGLFAILRLGNIGIAVVFLGSLLVNTPYLYKGHWQNQIGTLLLTGIIFACVDTAQSWLAARAYKKLEIISQQKMWAQTAYLPQIWVKVCLIPSAISMPFFIALQLGIGLIASDFNTILIRSIVLLLADTSGLILLSPLYPYIKKGTLSKELRKAAWYLIALLPPLLITFFFFQHLLVLLLPLLLLIAVRFRIAGTNIALLLITQLCIALTSQGYGQFVAHNPVASFLHLQIFIFSITLTLQYLAQSQTQIIAHRDSLESEVQIRTEALAKLNTQLSILATTDDLTQIPNRRAWQEKASLAMAHARRYDRPLSFIMIDVDHFKKINDQFGHLMGDMVLKRLAHLCLEGIRSSDNIARWGGEEFVILLAETDLSQAMLVAEKLRESVCHAPIVQSGENIINASISLGVTAMNSGDITLDDILIRADQAMYKAKESGRNCVICFEQNKTQYLQRNNASSK